MESSETKLVYSGHTAEAQILVTLIEAHGFHVIQEGIHASIMQPEISNHGQVRLYVLESVAEEVLQLLQDYKDGKLESEE